MPSWPIVTSDAPAMAAQYNALSAAIAAWLGPVSAAGNVLTDLPSIGLRSANASWQEFQLAAVAGASQSFDSLALQYNTRSTPAGTDSWASILNISLGGLVGVSSPLVLSGQVTFNGACYSNPNAPEYFMSGNTGWQEFQLNTYKGATAPNDQLQLQYNTRTIQAGTDNWQTALSIAAQTGAVTLSPNVGVGTAPRQQLTVGANLDLYCGAVNSPTQCSIRGSAAGLALNSNGALPLYLNWDTGTGGVSFGNGAQTAVASVSAAGSAQFSGLNITNPASITLGSNFQAWTPTFSAGGSMTVSSPSGTAIYIRLGAFVYFSLNYTVTLGGTANNVVVISLPVTAITGLNYPVSGSITTVSTTYNGAYQFVEGGTASLYCYLTGGGNFPLGSASFYAAGTYRVA